jgi:hypothetical protein
VRSAMPSVTAKRRCPDLIFVTPRFDVYKTVSLQIREIFAEYTPIIEPLSLDEAYLDVTENLKGIASATQIAEDIRAKIRRETKLTASAGVSYNKFLAKLASDHRKPDGLFVITPKMGPAFVENLPVAKFHGIGPATSSTENLLCVAIDDDFDEALRLSLLDGARHSGHRPPSDQDALPRLPSLGLRHTGATERWIYIKGTGGKTIADAAAIAIEKVGRDDLEVVVRCKGEGALSVAITKSPDAGHARAQLIVDSDIAARVGFDADPVEAEVVRIGAPADGQQHMRADDLSIA